MVLLPVVASLLAVLRLVAEEHEVEKVLWGHKLIAKALMSEAPSMVVVASSTPSRVGLSTLKRVNIAKLVVDPTFLRIRETCHCCINLLECLVCCW